jgi:hypothetical protein
MTFKKTNEPTEDSGGLESVDFPPCATHHEDLTTGDYPFQLRPRWIEFTNM